MLAILSPLAAVVADRFAPLPYRRGCAGALSAVLEHVPLDEALGVLLVVTAHAATDDDESVRLLVRALLAEEKTPARLLPGLRRLLLLALDRGHLATLAVVCRAMLDEDAYWAAVDESLVVAAFAAALRLDDEAKREAAGLLNCWLERHDAVPAWAVAAVRRHPEMHLSRRLGTRDSARLHVAAPTVIGWLALARLQARGRDVAASWRFGDRTDEAVATLAEAMRLAACASDTNPYAPCRPILRHWFAGLVDPRARRGES